MSTPEDPQPAQPAQCAQASADQAAQPVPGDRLVMGSIAEPTNLIPPLASDTVSHDVASRMYVAPLKYDKDLRLVPWAAESFEVQNEGRLLKFKLRQDIRWWDGVPLTVEDVAFTYRLMIDPKTPTAYGEDWRQIARFTVTGPYSFEVGYDEPLARALVTWASDILPKHALEGENLMDTKYAREPLGAGPYKLKEWISGQRVVLEANPDYFEGRPCLQEILYRFIPDTSTQFLELKSGNLDYIALTPQQYMFQTSGPAWESRYNKYKYLSFSYTFLGYNLRHPFFQDKRVRQALAHAVDKQEIIKGVLLGQGLPTIGPYKPGTWVYNEDIHDYAYDPDKAKAMLAEAGWRDTDGDGLLDKDGRPFAFTILTNQGNDQRIKTATIIQSRLKAIGIQVAIRTVEWASFLKEFVDKGRFDALVLGWTITQDPDNYSVWHSSSAKPGGLNFIDFKNDQVDELLERGRRSLDQDERKRVYDRLQEILHEEAPYLFLYAPMALPIFDARIHGIEVAPAGIGHNYIHWWVPKNEQRYHIEP